MKQMMRKNLNLKALIFVLAILGLLVFGFGKNKARAVEDCSAKETLEEQEKCKKDLQDKADDIRELIELKEKQETVLQNQLQLINLEKQKNATEFQKAQQKLAELTQQIYDLEGQIYEKEKLVVQQKSILASLMRTYYESFNEGLTGIVVIGTDISEMFSQSDYLSQISSKINEVLQYIRETKQNMEKDKISMVEKKDESEKIKEDLKKRGLTLQSNEDVKESQVSKTQQEKSKYEQLLSEINDEIYQLEAGKGEANLSLLPPIKKGYFTYPTSYVSPSQYYGCLTTSFAIRSYPACKVGSKSGGFHNGIDLPIKSYTYASKSGKVLATGSVSKNCPGCGYGNWIVVGHDDGLATLYAHLSSVSVSKGASVKEGQKIGVTGTTGYSTGTHLHFTVFSKNSFEVKESTKVNGLMLPIGSSVSPLRYL